ncbi:glycosyltransferase family 2 protein [Skermania piniformis]|uniref:Glycosyltransferase family 2 protein n=1 Tax=Skermania pinensis TaxID=39122 RepID=A0ABX8S5E7_9ACTN|nr:glycosyltransferase family 2 protein [Skermania piniformis]QXQ13075.1 glycosyltransferase family 2 protein [Skermania piniformis]
MTGARVESEHSPDFSASVTPGRRPLAVLVVAYRNADDLCACLDSVREQLGDVRTLVWDNSGPDRPEVAALAPRYPWVGWHVGEKNIGFAAGVNALARRAPGHDLLLLNPDAVLLGPLDATRAALAMGDVAAAAPQIHGDPGSGASRPWDVAHRRRGLIRTLVTSTRLGERLRGTPLSDLYGEPPREVDGYLTGACLAISRDAWDALGAFDEDYFLYGEESDWQHRARAAGWRLLLTSDAGIEHAGHGTVATDPTAGSRSKDLLQANIALNLEQHYGRRRSEVYLAGRSAVDRLRRGGGSGPGDPPTVVIVVGSLADEVTDRRRVAAAIELDRRGHQVQLVCLRRLGLQVGDVPHSIRLIRLPWWSPIAPLHSGPALLIAGGGGAERAFATGWRVGRQYRRWLAESDTPVRLADDLVTGDLAPDALVEAYEAAIRKVG